MSDEKRSIPLPIVGQDPLVGEVAQDGQDAGPAGAGALPMDRRQALKVMAIAAAGPTLASCAPGEEPTDLTVPAPTSNPLAAGTAWDPDLVAPTVPWERTLTRDELESLAVLCDVIVPADERSSSASQVGAQDFIDEWVSAPYDGNERDGVLIRGGLIWLDREADTRFGSTAGASSPDAEPEGGAPAGTPAAATAPETPALRFRDLTAEQKHDICDDICYEPNAPEGYQSAARFFDRVRYLTSTAFWTTTEGMQDLEYIGNIPLSRWDPPPPEVLRHIGLE